MAGHTPILIPVPRCISTREGGHPLRGDPRSTTITLASALRQQLGSDVEGRAELAGLPVVARAAAPEGTADDPEAYSLRICEDGAEICAAGREARLHGVHTLAQLIWNHLADGHLPGYAVADWPALSWRAFHLCYHLIAEHMPDLAPNLGALQERIRLLRHYKANAVVLELESLFPYRRHPRVANALAFSRDEWRAVAELCAEEGVEIIPLVQCLGHAYNVLRHPEYAHLREVPGTTQQYCPTNPEVIEFYMELVDELVEAFPGMRAFHVGGDESRRLGVCERCRSVVHERGLGALYGEHVGAICERLLARGLTPMVWADIVESAPAAAGYLPEGTTLVYWNYRLLNWSRRPAFGLLERSGHDMVTASAARFGTHNHTMYLYSAAMEGIGVMTRETARRGYRGTLVTDWMKAVPHELSVPALAYGMSEAWHAGGSLAEFEAAFARLYHHLPAEVSGDLARAYRLLEEPVPFLEDAQTRAIDRLDRFDLSGLTVRERIARYAAQDQADEARGALTVALRRGREAVGIADRLCAVPGPHARELGLLRISALTQVHKARMGLAFLEAARVLRYPTPDDAEARQRLVGEFEELVDQWAALREETRAALLPGTFEATVERALEFKFEADAREAMERFRGLLARGEQVTALF